MRSVSVGLVLLLSVRTQPAYGQIRFGPRPASDAERASVVAFNALIGGTAAAVRAFGGKRDVSKAFALGAIGGTVHAAGKLVASRSGSFPYAGVAISSTGTSIIANSGRGVRPLDEITLPIAFARLRLRPYSSFRVRIAVNMYEAAIAAQAFSHTALRFDSRRSLSSGALVFNTHRHDIAVDGDIADGIANGVVFVVSAFANDPAHTRRHELAHVQQHWFATEVFDRPVQEYLRRKVTMSRRLPSWLELGVFTPGLYGLERAAFGKRGPIHQYIEHEAEILARQ